MTNLEDVLGDFKETENKLLELEQKPEQDIVKTPIEPMEYVEKNDDLEKSKQYDEEVYKSLLDKQKENETNTELFQNYGIRTEKPEVKQLEESTMEDYLNLTNFAYIQHKNKKLRTKDNHIDPNFYLTEEHFKGLTPGEKDAIKYSSSEENMKIRLERYKKHKESSDKVNNDAWYVKFPGLLAGGLTDPTNLIPVGGAFKLGHKVYQTSSALGRITRTGVISGGIGAVTNVAVENLIGAQGMQRESDLSLAIMGFATGGILGSGSQGIGELLGSTVHKQKVATAMTEDTSVSRVMDEDKTQEWFTPEGETNPRVKPFEETERFKQRNSEEKLMSEIQDEYNSKLVEINEKKQKLEEYKLSEKEIKC